MILLIYFNITSTVSCKVSQTQSPKIYMVLRMDDYSNSSNFQMERKIFNIASLYNFPISVAPVWMFGSQPDEVEFLKPYMNNGSVEIASHGLTHAHFPSRPYSDQVYRLKESRRLLEEAYNTTIEAFAVPLNEYDNNTLKALTELEYKVISAHKDEQIKNESINFPELIYAHAQTMPWGEGIEEFKSLINQYRSSTYYMNASKALVLCAYFHAPNFVEFLQYVEPRTFFLQNIRSNLTEFNDFLKYLWYQSDLQVVTFNSLIELRENTELLNLGLSDPIPQITPSFPKELGYLSVFFTLLLIIGISVILSGFIKYRNIRTIFNG